MQQVLHGLKSKKNEWSIVPLGYLWNRFVTAFQPFERLPQKWSRSFEQLSPVAKRDHRGYAACICANGNAAKYASSGVAWLCA